MSDPQLVADDAKVVEALRFAGCHVNSIYDLVNAPDKYPKALPILVKMLSVEIHPRIREGIARALAVKDARPYAKDLVTIFKSFAPKDTREEHAKWAVGNALAVTASDEVIDEVIVLMADRNHGWTRAMLPLALTSAKNKRSVAVTALLSALHDDDLLVRAAEALARLKATEAVEPLAHIAADHPDRDAQQAARKALKRLEK